MPETLQETIAEPAFPAFWQVVRFIFFILTMLLLEVLHVGVEPVPETDREEVFPGLRVRAVLFSLGDSVTFILHRNVLPAALHVRTADPFFSPVIRYL